MEEKECTKCGEVKKLIGFYKKYGGPRAECKECSKKAQNKYKEKNGDKIKEIGAAYRRNNKKEINESQKKYREENKEICKHRVLQWREANYEEHITGKKRYYQENKETIIEKSKQYYKDNPHVRATQEQRRRARKATAENNFSTNDWKSALMYFDNKCAYCLSYHDGLQQDHIIPLSKGGGYTPQNIIPACPKCNRSKYTHDMESWFKKESFYAEATLINILRYVEDLSEKEVM